MIDKLNFTLGKTIREVAGLMGLMMGLRMGLRFLELSRNLVHTFPNCVTAYQEDVICSQRLPSPLARSRDREQQSPKPKPQEKKGIGYREMRDTGVREDQQLW
jgi:hypothetical protein